MCTYCHLETIWPVCRNSDGTGVSPSESVSGGMCRTIAVELDGKLALNGGADVLAVELDGKLAATMPIVKDVLQQLKVKHVLQHLWFWWGAVACAKKCEP